MTVDDLVTWGANGGVWRVQSVAGARCVIVRLDDGATAEADAADLTLDAGPIPAEFLPARPPRHDRLQPVFDDGLVALYHADALDVLEEVVEPGTIACLCTDPPYGQAFSGSGASAGADLRGDGARGGMRVVRRILGALESRWCPEALAFVFCHAESYGDFKETIETRLSWRNALIWNKGGGGPGDCSQDFARNFEMVIHANRGQRPLLGSRDGCVLDFKRTPRDRIHPTEKPVPLVRYLLSKGVAAGEVAPNGRPAIAFDAFGGSASMLVAARQLGIRAVACEIDGRWIGPAVERLRQTEFGTHLIKPADVAPEPTLPGL